MAGIGYLVGTVFLARKQTIGWGLKLLGGIGWVIFQYQHENYIFMAATMVLLFLMAYGLYQWSTGRPEERTAVDLFFEVLAGLAALIVMVRLLLTGEYYLSSLLETVIVIVEIAGTVWLAQAKVHGWYAYIVMSLLVFVLVTVVNPNPNPILGLLEFCSIYFYVQGIRAFSTRDSGRGAVT